jgi:hypothetical protein
MRVIRVKEGRLAQRVAGRPGPAAARPSAPKDLVGLGGVCEVGWYLIQRAGSRRASGHAAAAPCARARRRAMSWRAGTRAGSRGGRLGRGVCRVCLRACRATGVRAGAAREGLSERKKE